MCRWLWGVVVKDDMASEVVPSRSLSLRSPCIVSMKQLFLSCCGIERSARASRNGGSYVPPKIGDFNQQSHWRQSRTAYPNKLSDPATKVSDDDLNTCLDLCSTSIHLLMAPTCHRRRRAAPTSMSQDAGCPILEDWLRLYSAGFH